MRLIKIIGAAGVLSFGNVLLISQTPIFSLRSGGCGSVMYFVWPSRIRREDTQKNTQEPGAAMKLSSSLGLLTQPSRMKGATSGIEPRRH
jgi:hypothetical protein